MVYIIVICLTLERSKIEPYSMEHDLLIFKIRTFSACLFQLDQQFGHKKNILILLKFLVLQMPNSRTVEDRPISIEFILFIFEK